MSWASPASVSERKSRVFSLRCLRALASPFVGPLQQQLTVPEHNPLEPALLGSAREDCLLNGVGRSEAEDENRLGLTDSVSSVHRLQIAAG